MDAWVKCVCLCHTYLFHCKGVDAPPVGTKAFLERTPRFLHIIDSFPSPIFFIQLILLWFCENCGSSTIKRPVL
ncbi:hypothetical protein HZ326_13920 [Fusarium oxysporum f. sp. albedinis]|nr:hypothetical protein HZ326_13920 [Fusarium oxysporum f. sp. albedinis]